MLLFGALIGLLEHFGFTVNAEPVRPQAAAGERGERGEPYQRRAWRHWSDADDDCQDTRQEVLIAESEVPVKFRVGRRCKVAKGRWRCPYTGQVFTSPRKLDVDHLVPLAEAHRSGGYAWSRGERERYANALDDAAHLVAVAAGANRSKADKGPEAWMPQAEGYRCEYVTTWVSIKERWGLAMDPAERAYVEHAQQTCANGGVPPLPQGQSR